MQNKIFTVSICLMCFIFAFAQNNKIIFMPQWTPQSQFAGFYVAYEKGYYKQMGLQVELKHKPINSTRNTLDYLSSGEANIVEQQLISAMIARGRGLKIVNVMQLSQHCGMMCVSHKPINGIKSLNNLKIGKWKNGNAELAEITLKSNDVNVNWINFINGINLFMYKAVDATLCYNYSEYINILQSCGKIPENQILRFADYGLDYPEDGLYVTEDFYFANQDKIKKFIAATKKGWDYTRENPKEALRIVDKWMKNHKIVTNALFQKRMLEEVLKMQINTKTQKADYVPVNGGIFDAMVNELCRNKYIPRRITYEEIIK